MLKHRSRNRENTSIVYHHASNLNGGVTNGIQTVWLTESCIIAHIGLISLPAPIRKPRQPNLKMVYFVSANVDHFSESGLLFSMVAQGWVGMDYTAKNTAL